MVSSPGDHVPVFSLAKADPAEVDRALRDVGFLIVTDHGVDEALIDRCWRATAAWFALPADVKARAPHMAPDYAYGYSPLRSEVHPGSEDDARAREPDAAAPTAADEKEMWCIGPEDPAAGLPTRLWPDGDCAPEMREAQEAYFHAMEALSDRLLALFARALRLEDPAWFSQFNRRHASALRAINYPALDRELLPGQLRASAHTDYGAITILRAGGPGLQIFTRGGEWIDVPQVAESAFVINLGDLMSRWTDGRWLSTPHRVVVPADAQDAQGAVAARQAIAYFHNMDMDAVIETVPTCLATGPDGARKAPRYKPIKAGDHLMAKHEAATRGYRGNIYADGAGGDGDQ